MLVDFGGIWLAVFAREERKRSSTRHVPARAGAPRAHAAVVRTYLSLVALSRAVVVVKTNQTAPRARARTRGHTDFELSFDRISRGKTSQNPAEIDPFPIEN